MATRSRLAELLGGILGAAPPRPRRNPQRFPHKARLYADERTIADEHGLEVWRDFKPYRGAEQYGYNVYRTGTHPDRPRPSRPTYISVSIWDDGSLWVDVHRSEVLELLQAAAQANRCNE